MPARSTPPRYRVSNGRLAVAGAILVALSLVQWTLRLPDPPADPGEPVAVAVAVPLTVDAPSAPVAAVPAVPAAAHVFPSEIDPFKPAYVFKTMTPLAEVGKIKGRDVVWAATVELSDDLADPASLSARNTLLLPLPGQKEPVEITIRAVDRDVNGVVGVNGFPDDSRTDVFLMAFDTEAGLAAGSFAMPLSERAFGFSYDRERGAYVFFERDLTALSEGERGVNCGVHAEPDAVAGMIAPALDTLDADTAAAARAALAAEDGDVDTLEQTDDIAYNAAPGATVDLLALYNPEAKAWAEAGGAGTFNLEINLLVQEVNWIFQRSLVDVAIRLVGTHGVLVPDALKTNPSGSLSALGATTGSASRTLAEAHVLRNAYAADLVALFIDYDYGSGGTTGIAYVPGSDGGSQAAAFSTCVLRYCDTNNAAFTFAHELAHNFGAGHAREQSSSAGTHAYAAGHFWSHPNAASGAAYITKFGDFSDRPSVASAHVATLMTYEGRTISGSSNYYRGLPVVANPNYAPTLTTKTGATTYTSADAAAGTSTRDNARRMNTLAAPIAAYRANPVYTPALVANVDTAGTSADGTRYYTFDLPTASTTFKIVLKAANSSADYLDLGINGPSRAYFSTTAAGAQYPYTTADSNHTVDLSALAGGTAPAGRYHITVWAKSGTVAYTLRAETTGSTGPTAAPTCDLPAGTYAGARRATLRHANPAATIYYTLDGSTPTSASARATPGASITVDASGTLSLYAAVAGAASSPVVRYAYTIQFLQAPIRPIVGAADFNGDGRDDLLMVETRNGIRRPLVSFVNGTVASSVVYAAESNGYMPAVGTEWDFLAAADFNGDGYADIAWRNNKTGAVHFWFMRGNTIIRRTNANKHMDLNCEFAGIGDLNGDGRTDFVWRNKKSLRLWIWLMGRDLIETANYATYDERGVGDIAAIRDMDGDGKADLLWRRRDNGHVFVWYMDGLHARGGKAMTVGVGHACALEAVADFTGDGHPDLFWRDQKNGATYLWILNGLVVRRSPKLSTQLGAAYTVGAVGTFDADARADILWLSASAATQNTVPLVWLMNGEAAHTATALRW